MIAKIVGQKLHDRVTRGEVLSEEEQAELEGWYAQQDAEENKMLTANLSASPTAVRQHVDDTLMQIQTTTEHIRLLKAENAAMQREFERLRQMSEAELIAEQARLNLLFEPFTLQEEAEILEDIKQGEADFAAERYITLDDLKAKYADRLL